MAHRVKYISPKFRYHSYLDAKLLTVEFNMTLWYPNTDGTVKGLLEVISQDYEYEHLLPPQLPSKAPVSSIGTYHTDRIVTTDTKFAQQNGVYTDESSSQPPAVQSVSQNNLFMY
jgi:hypothetical protein